MQMEQIQHVCSVELTAAPTQTASEGSKYVYLNRAGHSTTESIQGQESVGGYEIE